MDVSKSVALVTGGARGIGKEIVLHLLEKGAKVSIVDILEEEGKQLEKECQTKYGTAHVIFLKCDVSDSQQLFDVFYCTKTKFGGLDIVCNNAGIAGTGLKIASKMIQINLTAVVEGTLKAIEMMSTKNGGEGGVVINMASVAGLDVGPLFPVYTATKTGIVAFTRSMTECVKEGVRVNCICPSFTDTNLCKIVIDIDPEFTKGILSQHGFVKISDIVKAMMRCVNEKDLVGNAIVVLPKSVIKVVEFPEIFATIHL